MAVQRSIFIYQQNSVSKQKCFFQNMFDNQSSLSPWPLGTRQNVLGVQITGTVQRDLNACNRQGTRLSKNYKVIQTLKTGAKVKMIHFSRGGGVMKTTNLRQTSDFRKFQPSLLRRNKVRSKTSENKRQKIQFKEYSENNM